MPLELEQVIAKPKVAVSYSDFVGGASVLALRKIFQNLAAEVCDIDYYAMMNGMSEQVFNDAYNDPKKRAHLFADAKQKAWSYLKQNRIDFLVLPGNDKMLDSQLYGERREEADEHYSFKRSLIELALYHCSLQLGIPTLGVCGGLQVITVYHGGKLVPLTATDYAIQKYHVNSPIFIEPNSLFSQLLKQGRARESGKRWQRDFFGAHHYAVVATGNGVVASAYDKAKRYVEALEHQFGVPVIATQFHPEINAWGFRDSEALYLDQMEPLQQTQGLFKALYGMAKQRQLKRQLLAELLDQRVPVEMVPAQLAKQQGGVKINIFVRLLRLLKSLIIKLLCYFLSAKQALKVGVWLGQSCQPELDARCERLQSNKRVRIKNKIHARKTKEGLPELSDAEIAEEVNDLLALLEKIESELGRVNSQLAQQKARLHYQPKGNSALINRLDEIKKDLEQLSVSFARSGLSKEDSAAFEAQLQEVQQTYEQVLSAQARDTTSQVESSALSAPRALFRNTPACLFFSGKNKNGQEPQCKAVNITVPAQS